VGEGLVGGGVAVAGLYEEGWLFVLRLGGSSLRRGYSEVDVLEM
jgi:hypothetical protein